MSSPNFCFVELAPGMGDLDLAEQAIILLHRNVWQRTIDRAGVDLERSKHLAVAIASCGQVVAAGALEVFPPDFFYITEIATDPRYQQTNKLGSTILGLLEDRAKYLGGKEIALSALPKSRIFFEKCGYQADRTPSISSLGMIKSFE